MKQQAGEKLTELFYHVPTPAQNQRLIALFISLLVGLPLLLCAVIWAGVQLKWWGHMAFLALTGLILLLPPAIFSARCSIRPTRTTAADSRVRPVPTYEADRDAISRSSAPSISWPKSPNTSAMKIVSFIECRQRDVIERILRHCGLWEGPLRTLTSARGPPGRTPQVPEPRCNLELVLDPKFTAAKVVQSGTHRSRELQLVLDPEFL